MQSSKPIVESINTHNVPSCPICKSNGKILFSNLTDRLYQSPGNWNLRKCNNQTCGLIWLDPRPNVDEIWKVYNNYYTHATNSNSILYKLQKWIESGYLALAYNYKNNTSYFQRAAGTLVYLLPTEKAEYDFNVFELSKKESGKLLDIGTGNGSFIQSMKNKGWDVEGIDSDTTAVELCISLGLNVKLGDLHAQKYPDNSFDVITLAHVIEHVYEPKELLVEIFRILKPEGQVIIATPNSKSWMFNKKFKSNWFSIQSPGHAQIFDRQNIAALLESCGYKIQLTKTSARNEFYVYTGSRSIAEKGYFAMGKEKPNKVHLILGKYYQLLTWLKLKCNKDAGGELFIKATK